MFEEMFFHIHIIVKINNKRNKIHRYLATKINNFHKKQNKMYIFFEYFCST